MGQPWFLYVSIFVLGGACDRLATWMWVILKRRGHVGQRSYVRASVGLVLVVSLLNGVFTGIQAQRQARDQKCFQSFVTQYVKDTETNRVAAAQDRQTVDSVFNTLLSQFGSGALTREQFLNVLQHYHDERASADKKRVSPVTTFDCASAGLG